MARTASAPFIPSTVRNRARGLLARYGELVGVVLAATVR